MMGHAAFRKNLGIPHLLRLLRQGFDKIPENRSRCKISLTDHLMSGIALFVLKYPSLLQFDQNRFCEQTQANLKTLYKVDHIPCDTQLRTRLDTVNPDDLRFAFTSLFALLQRGKVLEAFKYSINEKAKHYLTKNRKIVDYYQLMVLNFFLLLKCIVLTVVKNITKTVISPTIIKCSAQLS